MRILQTSNHRVNWANAWMVGSIASAKHQLSLVSFLCCYSVIVTVFHTQVLTKVFHIDSQIKSVNSSRYENIHSEYSVWNKKIQSNPIYVQYSKLPCFIKNTFKICALLLRCVAILVVLTALYDMIMTPVYLDDRHIANVILLYKVY